MVRTELINKLAQLVDAASYLEIGVSCGGNFAAVDCPRKVGVDPDVNALSATFLQTSDMFFASNQETFDLVFIDGLHHCEQVLRDIAHALACLNPGGFIICHDMNPLTESMQKVPLETPEWTGDCWKAWVTTRAERPDVRMFVVDTDYGCGVIQPGSQECLDLAGLSLNWNNLCRYRKVWLNLITVPEFLSWLNSAQQDSRRRQQPDPDY
ncbi:MAG: class I SAM-dependent methyltransferase [Planctomycetaceae bacterium]